MMTLSNINKEIACYHCLNARIIWRDDIWRLTDNALWRWVVSRVIQRCTLSFYSSKLQFQLAFYIRLTSGFNSVAERGLSASRRFVLGRPPPGGHSEGGAGVGERKRERDSWGEEERRRLRLLPTAALARAFAEGLTRRRVEGAIGSDGSECSG